MKITAKKSCKYDRCGSFEYLLLMFIPMLMLFCMSVELLLCVNSVVRTYGAFSKGVSTSANWSVSAISTINVVFLP